MPKTQNKPNDRIHQFDLKREKFKSTGIKESTLSRLNLARHALYTSFEREAYLVLERALELYYHNTSVFFNGKDWNLLELVNHLEKQDEDTIQN